MRIPTRLTVAATMLALCASTSTVLALDFDQRAKIQENLVWTGHYDGMVDGKTGRGTTAAINAFLRDNGFQPGVELSADQLRLLERKAQAERSRCGFVVITDEKARVQLGIPKALVTRRRETARGHTYLSDNGDIEIDILIFSEPETSFSALYERISERGPIKHVNYSMLRASKFVVSGDDGAKHHYFMALRDGATIRAFSLSFPIGSPPYWRSITIAMANSFGPAAGQSVAEPPTGWPRQISPFLDRGRLITIADKFLADAGIAAYKYLPNDDPNDPHLTWLYEDGGVGELMALRPGAGIPIEEVSNVSISREAKSCKGEFASARLQSRFFKGSEVQRVETRCKTGPAVYAVAFSIIELANGALLRFGSGVHQEASGQEATDDRATRVEDAALLLMGSKSDLLQ